MKNLFSTLTVRILTQLCRDLKVTSIARVKAYIHSTRLLIRLTSNYRLTNSKLKSIKWKNKLFIKENYLEDLWANDSLLVSSKLLLESTKAQT